MRKFNLEEETVNGYLITKEKKQIWQVQISLLSKLQEVCDKYNLGVFAEAGTFLGAVRHHGFIPWDDDIDVAMFRADYDRLLDVASKEFTEPFFLQTTYSDKKYILGHAQLRNSNTTAILKTDLNKNIPYNQGIFIDIFVLDAVPNDTKKYNQLKKKVTFRNKMLYNYAYAEYKNKSIKGKLFLLFVKIYFSIFSYKKFYKKNEDILRSISLEQSDLVAPLNFKFEIQKRARDKHLYDETILVDFENIQVKIPKDYDAYLKKRYGKDYMIPQNIPTTHGEVFFDLNCSYKKYVNKK